MGFWLLLLIRRGGYSLGYFSGVGGFLKGNRCRVLIKISLIVILLIQILLGKGGVSGSLFLQLLPLVH